MTVKKKVFWITTLIIITAIVIVLCVGYFIDGQPSEFDGTLVKFNLEFPRLI
ncbi:MAG: hypothetical protein PHF63_06550 [Herbinix sp.]|nr:hypothetical protein [Herbinix sp.]